MHIHIGLIAAVNIFMMWAIIRFFWLMLAERNADTAWGQAMAKLA